MSQPSLQNNGIIGRAEWVTPIGLDLPPLLARIDSGAKTSSLHAQNIQINTRDGVEFVTFETHTKRYNLHHHIACEAPLVKTTQVKSSNGKRSKRYVIEVQCTIGMRQETILMTLNDRTNMHFSMLMGRQAIQKYGFLIDVSQRYCQGVPQQAQSVHDPEFDKEDLS